MAKVLIIAEIKGEALKKSFHEMVSKAKSLGHDVAGFMIGEEVKTVVDSMVSMGTTTQYIVENPSLENFCSSSWIATIANAANDYGADQIWFGTSENSKVVAPAVATRLEAECCSGVIEIDQNDETVIVTRPIMAGKALQKIKFNAKPAVLVIQSGIFEVSQNSGAENVITLDLPERDSRVVVEEVIREVSGDIDLTDANIIVAIGRGVKDEEGVTLAREFANDLKAGFGASRALIDLGLMPHGTQIGQTGKTVSPTLYFAIGISGAIQHTAGISRSKIIVAVNKDPDAPIFNIADYGIVGDLFEIIPILRREIGKQ